MGVATRLASVGAIMLLGGCAALSAINPFASKAPRNPPAPLVNFTPTLNVHTAWTVPLGSSGAYAFAPAAAGNSVFAAAADGTIARVEDATGRVQWKIKAGIPLTAGVGSDGFTVAVGGAGGTLLAYDAEGKLRWKAQVSSEILSAPAVGQGLVVVRSLDNRIVAFDAESGTRRWTLARTAPALILRTAPGILIAGQSVYVALPGGRLLALALSNGGPRWEVAVSDPRGATELERIADVSGMPVLVGRDICAVTYQGRIGCFDAGNGALRWTKEFSSATGLGADQRFVFASDDKGVVHAFTRESGGSVWRNAGLANRRLSAPVSIGRAVAVGDGEGYVHFLSREDGAFLARAQSDGSAVNSLPVVAGSNLVFQTRAGALVALATE